MTSTSSFHFTIKEAPTQAPIAFSAPTSVLYHRDCLELLVERAANVWYYGAAGWKCEWGWPLTFMVQSDRIAIGQKIVFLMNGCDPPIFEVT